MNRLVTRYVVLALLSLAPACTPITAADSSASSSVSTASASGSSGSSACSADLMSDTKNCGACGHDCSLGDCAAGVCQPFFIAQRPAGAMSGDCRIAVHPTVEDHPVYWSNYYGSDVWTSHYDGSSISQLFKLNDGQPKDIAFSPASGAPGSKDFLYVANFNSGGPTHFIRYDLTDHVRDAYAGYWNGPDYVVVDSESVFFDNRYDTTFIVRASLFDLASPVPFYGTGAPEPAYDNIAGLAMDSAYLYWSIDGVIKRLRKDATPGALPDTIVEGDATALAVDGTHVFFSTSHGISRRRADGTGAIVELHKGPSSEDVAVDDVHVYWVTSPGGGIFSLNRVKKDGTSYELFLVDAGHDMALSPKSVYFCDANTISRIAK